MSGRSGCGRTPHGSRIRGETATVARGRGGPVSCGSVHRSRRAHRRSTGLVLVFVAAVAPIGGCAAPGTVDYRAEPAGPDSARADRILREWSGVRVALGPVSRFPYARSEDTAEGDAGEEESAAAERGVYQLFTRVRIENRARDTVVVYWAEARLVHPDGRRVRLIRAAPTSDESDGRDPSPPDETTVAPDAVVIRGLLPEPADTVAPDAPLVPLCDGCVYRIRLPVRVRATRHTFTFPFRLVARAR